MIINGKNCALGNTAMAAVLLLYYHLLDEGGFTDTQTVYLDALHFDAYEYLDVVIDESEVSLEIDQVLLREGAVIYLLCELKDIVIDYEDDFLSQPAFKKIMKAYEDNKFASMTLVDEIFKLFAVSEKAFDYSTFEKYLREIYEKYVIERFQKVLKSANE